MLRSKRTAIGCWMGKGGAIPLISQWAVVFHKRLGLRAWTKSRTVIQKNRSNTHGTYPDHFQKWRKSGNIIGFSQKAEFRGKLTSLNGKDHIVGPVSNYFASPFVSHQSDQQFLKWSHLKIWAWKLQGQGHGWDERPGSHSWPSIQPTEYQLRKHKLQ